MPIHRWQGRWNGRDPVGDSHQRARKVISPSGGIVRGKFPSRKNGRMIHHEGLLELDAIYLFETSPEIARYREQPSNRLFKEETIQAFPKKGLARVARMAGVGSQTLKRMVHNNWVPGNSFTGPSKREFITIDCTQLSHFIPDPADYFDMRSAACHLGIKRTRLRHLVDEEIISPDARPDWTRSKQWRFRRSEIFGFMEQIQEHALPTLSDTEVAVSLRHVLRYWRVTNTELSAILVAMRKREIPFALVAQGRLSDATFNESVLHNWLELYRRLITGSVYPPAAAKILRVKQQVVYGLIEKGLLVSETIVKREVSFTRVSLSSLESFQKEYVSLIQLAQQHNTSSTALMNRLKARPVTGPTVDGNRQYFFKREDIQRDFSTERLDKVFF